MIRPFSEFHNKIDLNNYALFHIIKTRCYKMETQNNAKCEKPLDELLDLYIEQFNVYEKVAYEIAKNNLESSYDMEKSIVFIEFLNEHNYIIL